MDLIIKPTELCNFSCTFCSSSNLVAEKTAQLELEKIYEFLKRFPETDTIIINGGDPLMMPVSYYHDLIAHLDAHEYRANISITTNLWKFWLEWKFDKPQKPWTELFKQPRVNVTTSFQYGEGRRINPKKVFDEKTFVMISDKFLEHVGYRPSFIAVIEEENLSQAIEHVKLAARLGVDCKLNYANMSGRCEKPLYLSKVYEVYLEVMRLGLQEHEWNTRQMTNRIYRAKTTVCPLNRSCDEGIRVIQPDGKYYSCGSFGDDGDYDKDFEREVHGGEFFTPLRDDPAIDALKTECYSCEMFNICNGCRKHVKDLKVTGHVEHHCQTMKKIGPEIMELSNKEVPATILNETYYEAGGFKVDQTYKPARESLSEPGDRL